MIFLILSLPFVLIRLARWIAITQQKEYRLDRFNAFIKSPEGQAELSQVFNFGFHKDQIKRPHSTPKSILITIFSLILFSFLAQLFNFNPIYIVMLYVLIPAIPIAIAFPFSFINAVLSKFYQYKTKQIIHSAHPIVVGITGSYGKTTTKILLHQILKAKYSVWKSPKSYNTAFSLPRSFVQTYHNQDIVIAEMGAYKAGEIAELAETFTPDMAILTGIVHQHLAVFGTLKELIKAKSELPQSLKTDSAFYVNADDKQALKIGQSFNNLSLIKSTQTNLSSPQLNTDGHLSFKLANQTINTNLIGLHYLPNLKLAIAISMDLGITPKQIKQQLESFQPGSEFIRLVKNPKFTFIIDDKTSNPKGFSAAIKLLSSIKTKPRAIISAGIVDLGNQSDSVHRQLATQAKSQIDIFVHTSTTATKSLQQTLKHKYIASSDPNYILDQLNQHKIKTILIEGKIPAHLQQNLLNL